MATIPWSIAAMCMVPAARTAREGKYETTAGVVKFAVGQSGSIVFLAPITVSLPSGRYVLRAHLERDDPVEVNTEPSLLGTNIRLRRRRGFRDGVEDLLVIDSPPVLGDNGLYTVDSPGRNLDEINVEDHYYWLQVQVQQESPATAQTRNSVIGMQLL
jgi:hypothetical protein